MQLSDAIKRRRGMFEDLLACYAEQLVPGAQALSVEVLDSDSRTAAGDETLKGAGYGTPRRVRLRDPAGGERSLVFHFATANELGHDRRADRAAEQLLAFDTFGQIPQHVRALDVGALTEDGNLLSLRDTSELYLVTEWADGAPYADDLRRLARGGAVEPRDYARCDGLARYLARLHAQPPLSLRPAQYRRALRDLVGSGEGIFGVRDAYGDDTPGAPPERLDAIERRCLEWRHRLRARSSRLTTVHGGFHPFNLVFDGDDTLRLLDASRGCIGDPADDVTALAINYVFFALDHDAAWHEALGPLWHRFWRVYVDASGDQQLYDVVAPFLAWRGLVVACPRFYPRLPAAAGDRILRLVERTLDGARFDPAFADDLFA